MIEHRDECHVVQFMSDTLFDPLELAEIQQEILDVVAEAERPKVVFEMANLKHAASATLSMLISVRSACQGKGGDAALAGVPGPILEILQVARLDTVFRIHENTAQAIIDLNG